MILGQKLIPQSKLLRLRLEFLEHGRVRLPSVFALGYLGLEEIVGGDAVFFDKFFDLEHISKSISHSRYLQI